jgi:hypothetical protein
MLLVVSVAMTQAGPTGAADRIGVSYHGYAHTHIDGFAHRFFDGKMWNGFSYEEVTREAGARKNSIDNLHNRIFTRGVLVDIPRLKNVPYLEPEPRSCRRGGRFAEALGVSAERRSVARPQRHRVADQSDRCLLISSQRSGTEEAETVSAEVLR